MLYDDMDAILREYFIWSRDGDPSDIGYPHRTPTETIRGSTVRSAQLSPDEAMAVDSAICALSRERPEIHSVVIRFYRDGKSVRWMHLRGEGDRRTLGRRLTEGHEFIHGFLLGAGHLRPL